MPTILEPIVAPAPTYDGPVVGPYTTYAELQAGIAAWLHRSDLTGIIPRFIGLAEAKFTRRLRVRQMERVLESSEIDAANEVSLPADVVAVKALWVPNYESTPLRAQTLESVVAMNRTSGVPTFYAWGESAWRFDGSGDVQGVYYRAVTPLSDDEPTNWLLSMNSDLYLWAALAEASFYVKDENRAAMWTSRTDALIDELNGADKRDSFTGPLVARAR